jgi:hypothetical protein
VSKKDKQAKKEAKQAKRKAKQQNADAEKKSALPINPCLQIGAQPAHSAGLAAFNGLLWVGKWENQGGISAKKN